jgi:hypothetical protein
MKAVSIRQPFAELVAQGRKTLEIRSWRTHHRGPLLVCTGVAWHREGVRLHGRMGDRGVAVCMVDVVDCRALQFSDASAACFDVSLLEPQWAWVLANPRRVQPTPIRGSLMLFDIDDAAITFSASEPGIAGPQYSKTAL